MTSSSSSWSSTPPDDYEDDEYEIDKEDHSLLLIIMFATHFCFFLFTYFWLYPTDEPPKTAVLHKLATDIKESRITGEPIRPSTRLYPMEINLISRQNQCIERRYQLSLEDQKTLMAVREGEVNYLKNPGDLSTNMTMNYGSLIVKRGVPVAEVDEMKNEIKNENMDEEAAVEDLLQLKREKAKKEPENKKKRKKTKERMDALDQLTRGQSAEKLTLFSRIIPDLHGGQVSKKQLKIDKSTIRIENETPTVTVEEDQATQQRVIKKPSTMRPHRKPSTMEVQNDVKKKKSATLKDGQKPSREDASLAKTIEETTRSRGLSRESIASLAAPPP